MLPARVGAVQRSGSCLLPQVFAVKYYQPRLYEYPKFDATFRRMLTDAEAAADSARRPTRQPETTSDGRAGRIVRAFFFNHVQFPLVPLCLHHKGSALGVHSMCWTARCCAEPADLRLCDSKL